jgi:hypothetical protein
MTPGAMEQVMETVRRSSLGGATARTKAEIRELFHDLVPPGSSTGPEIVPLRDWWPDGPLLKPRNG